MMSRTTTGWSNSPSRERTPTRVFVLVRITAENPKWVEVEILRTEDALAADLGVTGINDFGETITSFSELVLGESKVRLLRLTPEPIH